MVEGRVLNVSSHGQENARPAAPVVWAVQSVERRNDLEGSSESGLKAEDSDRGQPW